jgi:hypothetical protein
MRLPHVPGFTTAAQGGGDQAGGPSRDTYLLEDRIHRCDLLFTADLPDEAYTRLFEIDLDSEFEGVTATWDKDKRDWRPVGPRGALAGRAS